MPVAPIVSLLVVLTLSMLVTRIATVALAHTGLSREAARFQARSAFTGVGFTTSESESVVNHPVRRRILVLLMLSGNTGIVTAMSTLILTFVRVDQASSPLLPILLLTSGVVALRAVASSRWVDRRLSRLPDRLGTAPVHRSRRQRLCEPPRAGGRVRDLGARGRARRLAHFGNPGRARPA